MGGARHEPGGPERGREPDGGERGGRVLSFHFSFGDYDGVTISEAPDDKTAATIALVVASTDHLKNLKTTTLFSVDETMEVLRRVGEISYQGPGQ